MVSFSAVPLWDDPDPVLRDGRLGLLCNQAAWHRETGEYLFETLYARGNLKRVFIPEHGLFGELQDQVKLEGPGLYSELDFRDCEFVSLYGSGESSLTVNSENLTGLDALVIELQDVGVRYYTFLSTLRNLFTALKTHNIPLPVWLLDRENPAGPSVEGTPLKTEYSSFIGIKGLPHRYGLTIGELAHYFYAEIGADFPLRVVSWRTAAEPRLFPWVIAPSPNIPGFFTARFYSGQCLWEGTNVSEGRGTTRPFEVFGAPWMEKLLDYNRKAGLPRWNAAGHPLADPGVFLRWHRFIPVFHKYQDQCCFGFHLIPKEDEIRGGVFPNPGRPYHALMHALRIIRFTAETCEDFSFRPGTYEAGNGKTAIELLAGDPVLLDYLAGRGPAFPELREYLRGEEEQWIDDTRGYRFYGKTGSSSENLYSATGRM
jgi:uncharacterized protein YbbC (DUF1343 family)